MRWLVLLAALLAGCASPDEPEPTPPTTVLLDPPEGEGWADCPPAASVATAIPFRAEPAGDAEGRGPGVHRLDAQTFLYVWADYRDDLHEDRVTRVNPVETAVDTEGRVHVCTRVDLATPLAVDPEPRTYAVAVRLTAEEDLSTRAVRLVVNWTAGCPCDPLPRGHAIGEFDRCDGNASCT